MDFSKKIKLLYMPFLLTYIGLVVGYTFLNWLLIIELEVLSVKEIIINLGIPLALPWIPILLYLLPKLKLLNMKTAKDGSWTDFYMIVLWLILAAPLILAQHYIETATGKLTELKNLSQITTLPKTKFYSIEDVYIEKNNIGTHTAFEVSGKHNENFDMDIYVVVPMYNNYADTTTVVSWLGVSYAKTISNNLEDKEKEEAYGIFAEESQKKFDAADLNDFVYLSRVPNSDDSEGFKEALKSSAKRTSANETQLFSSVHEPFQSRNGSTLEWTLGVFGFGAFFWLVLILLRDFDESVVYAYEAGVLDTNEDVKEFADFLKPKEGFFITPILMYLNVGIFLAMFFMGLGFMSFKSSDLIIWGANYGPLTENGEWWRLVSSTFLHGGFMHVFANMYGLLFVGIFLEPLLGKMKYLGVYLITGIVASAASLWWNNGIVSIGASGAIFGLYGVFLALLVTRVFPKEIGTGFLISALIFVGFNLLMGVFGNGIDNAAHIGGLGSGFLIGLALYPSIKGKFPIEEDIQDEDVVE